MTISGFDAADAGPLVLVEAGDGVVAVVGELDVATSGLLIERLSAPPAVTVIDLSDVTFIDAGGLRALIDATGCAGANRRRLRSPSRPVVRICEITGLTPTLLHAPA